MRLNEKLKKAREHFGKSQKEMAALTGSGYRSWQGYEQGTSVPGGKVFEALTKLGFNVGWFFSDDVPMLTKDTQPVYDTKTSTRRDLEGQAIAAVPHDRPEKLKENGSVLSQTQIPNWEDPDPGIFDYVPMAKAQLSAGGGSFVLSEDVVGYYAFRKDWLKRTATSAENVVLMTVQGGSMAPTIKDKDTVMIDTGRTKIIEGQIYAMRLEDTIMIKRLTQRPGGIINVISDNKEEFETYQAKRSELFIIGQIIFFCRDLVAY